MQAQKMSGTELFYIARANNNDSALKIVAQNKFESREKTLQLESDFTKLLVGTPYEHAVDFGLNAKETLKICGQDDDFDEQFRASGLEIKFVSTPPFLKRRGKRADQQS